LRVDLCHETPTNVARWKGFCGGALRDPADAGVAGCAAEDSVAENEASSPAIFASSPNMALLWPPLDERLAMRSKRGIGLVGAPPISEGEVGHFGAKRRSDDGMGQKEKGMNLPLPWIICQGEGSPPNSMTEKASF